MNAQTKVKGGAANTSDPYSALAHRMMADGVRQIRYYVAGYFSAELLDGTRGVGLGVDAAVSEARKARVAS